MNLNICKKKNNKIHAFFWAYQLEASQSVDTNLHIQILNILLNINDEDVSK